MHSERCAARSPPRTTQVDAKAFDVGVRQLLSELGSSHSAFYLGSETGLLPQHSIGATVRSFGQDGDERWFFLDVFPDGPPHRSSIKPGAVLLTINNVSCPPPSLPRFRTGQTCSLKISNITGRNLREISVEIPRTKATKGRPPIVEPKSLAAAIVEQGFGLLKIAYFPGAMGMRKI